MAFVICFYYETAHGKVSCLLLNGGLKKKKEGMKRLIIPFLSLFVWLKTFHMNCIAKSPISLGSIKYRILSMKYEI